MTTDPALLAAILTQADAGTPVATIAASIQLTPGHVYTILRRERPDRARKARRCTSDKPAKVLHLVGKGHDPRRVAVMLGVTRSYVYRLCKEGRT